MKKITTEKVPVWAISYLEYGDATGLLDNEIEEIDLWLKDNLPNGYICDYGNFDEYFSSFPLFGVPCSVVDTDFYEA